MKTATRFIHYASQTSDLSWQHVIRRMPYSWRPGYVFLFDEYISNDANGNDYAKSYLYGRYTWKDYIFIK
jgi:hypothetical protein